MTDSCRVPAVPRWASVAAVAIALCASIWHGWTEASEGGTDAETKKNDASAPRQDGASGAIVRINPSLLASDPSYGPDSIVTADLKEWVNALACPGMKGRMAYSPECDRAAEYIAAKFKEWKLTAPFPGGSYFQEIKSLVRIKGTGSGTSLVLFRGADDVTGKAFDAGKAFVPHPAGGEGEAEGEAVFAGYGISDAKAGYDDYAGLDAKGKIVLLLRYAPRKDVPGAPFSGKNFPRVASLDYKLSNAKEHGAKGVLMVQGPLHQQEGREEIAFPSDWRGGVRQTIPMLQVSVGVADAVLEAGGAGKLADIQKAIEKDGRPASRALGAARLKMASAFVKDVATSRNVIGIVAGADAALADEAVVIGAHYDHIGLGEVGSRGGKGKVHPGADDNASGVAGLLALARAFAKNPARPRRSIVFAAFTGEEIGLVGSQHYVEHPVVPLEKTSAMINLDMIGRASEGRVAILGAGTSPAFKDILRECGKANPDLKQLYGSSGLAPGDNASFFRKGVPVLFFHTGLHADYHTPSDTPDKLNYDACAEVCRLVYRITAAIAEMEGRPPFSRPAEGAFLGVTLVTERGGDGAGAIVESVQPGSPADRHGLEAGDVITGFDGRPVRSANDLYALIAEKKPGDTVTVAVRRDGAEAAIKVRLGVRGR
ncbi:MAG: M20/M25/M40 family metallo-hydrolase [Planctomycetota bacterium]|nr:M20/M25/M40 family metallo-hydrolase [Planctomycetota bacterium]